MNADNDFQIGKDHTVCEDYSLSGVTKEGAAFAIVCDGCSASPEVDIGARLLALSAREHIFWSHLRKDPNQFAKETTQHANEARLKFSLLHPQCLDATLLVAYVQDNYLTAFGFGDGVIIHKNKSGLWVHHIELTSGAPDYLSYNLFAPRMSAYDQLKDNEKQIVWKRDTGAYQMEIRKPFDPLHISMSVEEGDIVAVISDGINSFRKADNTAIDWKDLVDEFIGFKNFEGQFVLRRLAAFKRKCIKDNWHHHDDISMAAIVV